MARYSLFVVLLALAIPCFSSAASPAIENACRDFVDPNFCVASLQAASGSETADARGIASISHKLSVANATATLSKLATFKKTATDAGVMKSAEACEILYKNTAAALKWAGEFAASNHFDMAVVMYETTLSAPSGCGQILANGFDVDGTNLKMLMLMTRHFSRTLI
ncbi:invertase inhibitor [Canna indica]|uniref:Invertase inhibitor n=1 Tax=Canna indica TaxID=4628 RepID=A0AAQ3JX62_9LILI|nr:invertase inhibitor [Canna indica]